MKKGESKTVVIVINGIANRPGSSKEWTDMAVTWIHLFTPWVAEKWEYWAGPLTRRFLQAARVRKILGMMRRYHKQDFKIILVGHSNGCDIISRIVKSKIPEGMIDKIHLFAPACECDFEKNGFNEALIYDTVGKIYIYGSENDKSLKLAYKTRKYFLRFFKLGYGSLGLTGPTNIQEGLFDRVDILWNNSLDHSDWWSEKHFFDSMKKISNPKSNHKQKDE